jgi:hypothetical protein
VQITLYFESYVRVSYVVNMIRHGQPDLDSWTWTRWGTIATRLVLDGKPYRQTSTELDGTVRLHEAMSGEMVVALHPGIHTVRLQWRAFGSNREDWAVLRDIMDGYAGGAIVTGIVNSYNNPPLFRGGPLFIDDATGLPVNNTDVNLVLASGCEDSVVAVEGIIVDDYDAIIEPDMSVSLLLTVDHGTLSLTGIPHRGLTANGANQSLVAPSPSELAAAPWGSLTFLVGDGAEDAVIHVTGTLPNVNAAINSLSYRSFQHFNGWVHLNATPPRTCVERRASRRTPSTHPQCE